MDAPFAAEVTGIDLASSLDAGTVADVNHAFIDHGVLCFRGQHFETPDVFLAAAHHLGEPMPPVTATYRLPGYAAIEALTNHATGPASPGVWPPIPLSQSHARRRRRGARPGGW
jgi:alpha-ketoglutarate-dependent taurine dioxygenase